SFRAYAADQFHALFKNSGAFYAQANGTAAFATFHNAGDVHVQKGTLHTSGTFSQTAGSLALEGGAFGSARTLLLSAGWLGGGGTIAASVKNSGGVVAPAQTDGAAHRLTILGNYTQTNNGGMALLLQGPAGQSTYDQVVVSGRASLAGALQVTQTGT